MGQALRRRIAAPVMEQVARAPPVSSEQGGALILPRVAQSMSEWASRPRTQTVHQVGFFVSSLGGVGGDFWPLVWGTRCALRGITWTWSLMTSNREAIREAKAGVNLMHQVKLDIIIKEDGYLSANHLGWSRKNALTMLNGKVAWILEGVLGASQGEVPGEARQAGLRCQNWRGDSVDA
ncbi:unnamed protein product [Symbiodinium natans]|uniref:Uncharacterized protein n=1 Tax=Symbiodinium natans TaxID=878477 RepID=A0A812TK18_9DINO|nr:unnamed protein product [Symbiodinium natans]